MLETIDLAAPSFFQLVGGHGVERLLRVCAQPGAYRRRGQLLPLLAAVFMLFNFGLLDQHRLTLRRVFLANGGHYGVEQTTLDFLGFFLQKLGFVTLEALE